MAAGVTKCLKVGDLIPTALDSWCYVVHFQGTLVSRDATKLATKFGVLKDFIAQGTADIAGASPTVLPNHITAPSSCLLK